MGVRRREVKKMGVKGIEGQNEDTGRSEVGEKSLVSLC